MAKKRTDGQKYKNWQEVVIAIVIGAAVSFLATVFDGLADLLRSNSEGFAGGAVSTAYWLAKHYRA